MKFSIVIPVFNEEKNIKKLLDSLMNIKVNDKIEHEIIIVDNNSTDETVNIIKKYPVKFLSEQQVGSYAARNTGINNSKGDYICFTDGDCRVDPYWLINSAEVIKNKKNNFMIAGEVVKDNPEKNIYTLYDDICFLDQNNNVKNNVAVTANIIIPKVVFEQLGLFDARLTTGGDFDFTNKAVHKGIELIYSEKVKVYHKSRDTFSELLEKLKRFTKNQNYFTTNFSRFKSLGFFPGKRKIYRSMAMGKISIYKSLKILLLSFILGVRVTFYIFLSSNK